MPAVLDLVRPAWPPLAHVERGWNELTPKERQHVERRLSSVLKGHSWGEHPRDALLHFFTFLAQVETIAIEIPLRFLPHAKPEVQPLLRRQLVDEVFHSMLFARLAHELALPSPQPPPPLASAERLLERIRREPDLAVTATMLNLVAEGWIETLFKHAQRWGIAPKVFTAVLADESRHVDEASAYLAGVDHAAAERAVHGFEQGMVEVGAEPTVALSILHLAGHLGQQQLGAALYRQHREHLAEVGLQPSPGWEGAVKAFESMAQQPLPSMPTRVADTHWRRLARRVWQTPRDPTMQGDFDIHVGHIPRKALTPVLIAAVGRAWAKHPELNRIVSRDGVWQLPYANVGVRVLLGEDELATVLIMEADKRSVRDIGRMLKDGIDQLTALRASAAAPGADPREAPAEVASLVPALPQMFSVALSNAGKWGIVRGTGSFSGWVSPSTDITVGVRRRLPRWRGFAYLPSWAVNIAAIQDHRVFDGRASATTVSALQEALSPAAVRAILATPDSIPAEDVEPTVSEMQSAMAVPAVLGAFALPKYTPFVLGGLGIGALTGIGGYMLYRNLNAPPPAPLKRSGPAAPLQATDARVQALADARSKPGARPPPAPSPGGRPGPPRPPGPTGAPDAPAKRPPTPPGAAPRAPAGAGRPSGPRKPGPPGAGSRAPRKPGAGR